MNILDSSSKEPDSDLGVVAGVATCDVNLDFSNNNLGGDIFEFVVPFFSDIRSNSKSLVKCLKRKDIYQKNNNNKIYRMRKK